MTQQYQQQGINEQREQAVKNYIFDSTALVTNDFLFNDWDALLNQIRLQGGIAEIIATNENGFVTVIPPGTYDMSNISFKRLEGRLTRIQLDGVRLNNLTTSRNVIFLNSGSVPNLVYDEPVALRFDEVAFLNLGTAPMIQVNAAVTIGCSRCLFFAVGGDAIEVTAGNSLGISVLETAIGGAASGAITGAGSLSIVIEPSSSFFRAAQSLTGGIVVTQRETYEADGAVGVVWAGSAPTDFKTAMDRVAAAVAAAHGAIT